ncbi:MAG: SCP2 sterol-binding domain-containing protein [Rhodanobacter sp.]
MTASAPNAWFPPPLRKLAGRALQAALNRVLALDVASQQALHALDGRSVQVHLRGPELALAISVIDGQLQVGPPQANNNLRVAATPGALLAMAMRGEGEGPAPGKVEIAGDAELARRLQNLARDFAPDFEEAFAQTFGDVLGVPIARAVRLSLGHVRVSASHLTQDGAAWLRDESRLALAPGEVESFLDEVDTLRERSERLDSRVRRLAARAHGAAR